LATKEEDEKLLSAELIHEVGYTTWLANVIMVTKDNDKWRMCVDYTNLNKACPKDLYPLPCRVHHRVVDGSATSQEEQSSPNA